MNDFLEPQRARRLIQHLIDHLTRLRMGRSGVDEQSARRSVWADLCEHAGLEDPNRLTADEAETAVWVLLALGALLVGDEGCE